MFRQFVFELLGKRPELQVVGEASDGLKALQKAVELRPDLILLDIGLPSLTGIEVARQMRSLVPESKIIFLAQETSATRCKRLLAGEHGATLQKVRHKPTCSLPWKQSSRERRLSVTYQQLPISTSHLSRVCAIEWDIATSRLQRGEFILASVFRDRRQFRLRNDEVRAAAI
jgi:CheY-like chemotaxis protein